MGLFDVGNIVKITVPVTKQHGELDDEFFPIGTVMRVVENDDINGETVLETLDGKHQSARVWMSDAATLM